MRFRDDDISYRIASRHLPFWERGCHVDLGVSVVHVGVGQAAEMVWRTIKDHAELYTVCNHTATHDPFFRTFAPDKQREEFRECNRFIQAALGYRPSLFIPPYGRWDLPMLDVALGEGLELHPSYRLAAEHPESYIKPDLEPLAGRTTGWYICHTTWDKPDQVRLTVDLGTLAGVGAING